MKKPVLMTISRAIGAQVCRLRDHRYYYRNGTWESWCAYQCVRCGEWDRSFDELPYAPDDDDLITIDDPRQEETAEQDSRRARRWFAWLPWPRWL